MIKIIRKCDNHNKKHKEGNNQEQKHKKMKIIKMENIMNINYRSTRKGNNHD
jgi:hypothetical protein